MAFKKILIIAAGILIIPVLISAQSWVQEIPDGEADNYFEVVEAFDTHVEKTGNSQVNGWKQFNRWASYWESRVRDDGSIPDARKNYWELQNFLREYGDRESLLGIKAEWEEAGPYEIPENRLNYESSGIGRINVVRTHPYDPDVIWVGAATGGAWVSTNAGNNWKPIDMSAFSSIGVADIAISEANPSVIYIATGDDNGFFQEDVYSIGIIKSTDGGDTWELTSKFRQLSDAYLAARILVHPDDENRVLAATNEGIFLTTDGGINWDLKTNNSFFREMEYHPTNKDIVYAVTSSMNRTSGLSRFYKSTDGGENWSLIESFSGSNRCEIAVTPDNPDKVYVLASSTGNQETAGGFAGLFMSTDEGDTFEKLNINANILGRERDGSDEGGQGFYDLCFVASPGNEGLLFVGGINLWRVNVSQSGQVNYQSISDWRGFGGLNYVHADMHDLWYDPNSLDLYVSNDGGVYRSKNNASTWEDITTGIGIQQFYRISTYSDGVSEHVVGGTQDNGTNIKIDGEWFHVNGGDGMECIIDPSNPRIVYSTLYYGSLFRSNNFGKNFNFMFSPQFVGEFGNWVTPFVIDPNNPNNLYVGYINVYKSTNRGDDWDRISTGGNSYIDYMVVSKANSNYIYYVRGNTVIRSVNGGSSWENYYSAPRRINSVFVHPNDPDKIYVALSGYADGVKVIEYNNGAEKNISGNLPNVPANALEVFVGDNPGIFAGTDIGVFFLEEGTVDWVYLNSGMPNVVISDLEMNYNNGRLYAGTWGRGIWSTQLNDCDIPKPTLAVTGEVEFCQGDSVLLEAPEGYDSYYWSTGEDSRRIYAKISGNYYVRVKDESGCSIVSDAVEVTVFTYPELKVNAQNDGVLCEGDEDIRLAPNQIGFKNIKWSNSEEKTSIRVSEPGEYYMEAESQDGCKVFSDTVTVFRQDNPPRPYISQWRDTLWIGDDFDREDYNIYWYKDSVFIPDNDSIILIIEEPGEYHVRVLDQYGCESASEVISVVSSVDDTDAGDKITLAPNPGDGIFNIISPVTIDRIEIYNTLGNRVEMQANSLSKIDISSAPDGVYLVKLTWNGKITTKMLIKKSR
jgi:hypothetical protein